MQIPTPIVQSRRDQIIIGVFKATVTFVISTLFTLVPALQTWLGFQSHFVSLAVLFNNPVKSVGMMLESTLYTLFGISLAFLLLYVPTAVGHDGWLTRLSLLFVSGFILSFLKARYSRASVYSSTIVTQFLIIYGFTQTLSNRAFIPLLAGALLSPLCSLLIYPQFSGRVYQKNIHQILYQLQCLLQQLTDQFLLVDTASIDGVESQLDNLESFVDKLATSIDEARFEFCHTVGGLTHVFQSLNQHVGGMHSSVKKMQTWLDALKETNRDSKRVEVMLMYIQSVASGLRSLLQLSQEILYQCFIILQDQQQWTASISKVEKLRILQALKIKCVNQLANFNAVQTKSLMKLYSSNSASSLRDEAFLVYFYAFCMVEFVKGLASLIDVIHGDISGVKQAIVGNDIQQLCEQETQSDRDSIQELEQISSVDDEVDYVAYVQSQNSQYVKAPTTVNKVSTDKLWMVRYRLMFWRILSNIGQSHTIKFAFKSAVVIVLMSIFAFLPSTAETFKLYRGSWSILSFLVVLSPTSGGTNSSGLYRILGTIIGALYSIAVWLAVSHNSFGLGALVSIFAVPCFYVNLYSKYPRVGQVTLVALCAILLADVGNVDNPGWDYSIIQLAYMRSLMVIVGIIVGLIVSWYVWPYEARVELRKGASNLLISMGLLYSRLVEVFNYNSEQEDTSKFIDGIRADTIHRYYYARFDMLSTDDTLQYFMAFELRLHNELVQLNNLLPLTRLEPRLKGPFPVQIYKDLLTCCQNILDKFVAMRVAIANNVDIMGEEVRQDILQSPVESDHQANEKRQHSRSRSRGGTLLQDDLILGFAPSQSGAFHPNQQQAEVDSMQLLQQLHPYRKEMVGQVLLLFYLFGGCLLLKQPLPTFLPPARQARRRLMEQLKALIGARKSSMSSQGSSTSSSDDDDDDKTLPLGESNADEQLITRKFINYYAYQLAMEDVIVELEKIGGVLKKLFGEIFADVISMQPTTTTADQKMTMQTADQMIDITSPSTPVHHNRADQWGNLRSLEIEESFKRSTPLRPVSQFMLGTPATTTSNSNGKNSNNNNNSASRNGGNYRSTNNLDQAMIPPAATNNNSQSLDINNRRVSETVPLLSPLYNVDPDVRLSTSFDNDDLK
ncbi:hypothetical protein MIR68_012572 [Amoeboaphelidium protococcarum]|nr:hypothetical protein MIR68_012572 [Amoeboaphelidium protococcarum]